MASLLYFIESHQHGGTDRYLFDLANALAAQGHEVQVLCNSSPDFMARAKKEFNSHVSVRPLFFLTADGLTHAVQKSGLPSFVQLAARALLFPFRYLFYLPNLALLYLQLPKQKPAAFHVVNGGYPGAFSCPAAARAARLRGYGPILFSVLNTPFARKVPVLDAALDGSARKAVDLFIPNARALGESLVSLRGIPASKIKPILTCAKSPASLPSLSSSLAFRTRYGLGADDYVMVYLAMFERVKNHAGVLEAFSRLLPSIPNAKLVLGGAGKTAPALRAQVQALGLEKSVLFPGPGQVNEWCACADLVLYPSLREGLPYALEEAMHFGKPIIATRVGGVPELIEDGRDGLLVAPGDAQALAEAVLRVHQDSALAKRLGSAAQKRVKSEFTIEKMVDETKRAYGL